MHATAPSSGSGLTPASVLHTPPRSVPRIASTRKTTEIGMPTAAATTSERLRPFPGTSGMRGAAAADATDESGTTVTLQASLYGSERAIRRGRGRP